MTDFSAHYPSTPSFVSGGRSFVPRLGPAGISLESYLLPTGFFLKPSSATTVRAEHTDGRQMLFTR